jgi:hypothetical protein
MRHFSKLVAASTLAVVGLTAQAANVSPAAPDQAPAAPTEPAPAWTPRLNPNLHRHVGTYVRFDGGLGYSSTSFKLDRGVGLEDVTFSGVAIAFGGSVGGAVSENLILGGRFFLVAAPNPSVSISGLSGTSQDTTLSTIGLGPELTYYFMPANVYLSATVALTRQVLTYQNTSGNSDLGFGFQAGVGKQWWLGPTWSLGVGGQFTFSSNSDSGQTISNFSAAGVVSVSMN